MIGQRFVAGAFLLFGLAFILWSLRRQDKAEGNTYRIGDLLLGDDNKASKAAHVMFGAFFLSSWVVVNLTLNGHLTDVIFAAYLAVWVTPAVTRLIVSKPTDPAIIVVKPEPQK